MLFQNRIDALKRTLRKRGLDAILVSSVPNITYLTGYSNFSKDEREAYLLITSDKQLLITDGRYSEAVHKEVPHFETTLRSATASLKKILRELSKKYAVKTLGGEEDNLAVSEYTIISSHFDTTPFRGISILRSIKEKEEVEAIEKACKLGDETFDYILGKVHSQISEKELAFEIEYFIKKHGADISFPPIVAFGTNSSIPHHQTSNLKLKTKNIILLDFGVKTNNYCSDMTRTVFFGSANTEFKKMYQTVLDAQQKVIDFLNHKSSIISRASFLASSKVDHKSLKASDVDKVARDYIISKGYPTIPHSLGHGIGLEVHESPSLSPNSKDVLKPGMVFSIEPGIYIPGFGGVRVEDLVVLEKSNANIITHSPKKLIEL